MRFCCILSGEILLHLVRNKKLLHKVSKKFNAPPSSNKNTSPLWGCVGLKLTHISSPWGRYFLVRGNYLLVQGSYLKDGQVLEMLSHQKKRHKAYSRTECGISIISTCTGCGWIYWPGNRHEGGNSSSPSPWPPGGRKLYMSGKSLPRIAWCKRHHQLKMFFIILKRRHKLVAGSVVPTHSTLLHRQHCWLRHWHQQACLPTAFGRQNLNASFSNFSAWTLERVLWLATQGANWKSLLDRGRATVQSQSTLCTLLAQLRNE